MLFGCIVSVTCDTSCSTKLNGESLGSLTEGPGAESTFGLNLISPGDASAALVNRYKIEGFDPGSE
uniref:Uncharacterized protein n=1 Tax=uncultured planctomycete 6N14 TaxID=455069 RepID=A9LGT7_9BACT|nr:hypothetical protein 6N14_15 [uncultured planctomycete 6N14]